MDGPAPPPPRDPLDARLTAAAQQLRVRVAEPDCTPFAQAILLLFAAFFESLAHLFAEYRAGLAVAADDAAAPQPAPGQTVRPPHAFAATEHPSSRRRRHCERSEAIHRTPRRMQGPPRSALTSQAPRTLPRLPAIAGAAQHSSAPPRRASPNLPSFRRAPALRRSTPISFRLRNHLKYICSGCALHGVRQCCEMHTRSGTFSSLSLTIRTPKNAGDRPTVPMPHC